jgi:hypothetical protein
MQARLRNNSASDGGWEELSLPDEVRSVNSSLASEDDEVVILAGNASPRTGSVSPQRRQESSSAVTIVSKPISPVSTSLELFRASSAAPKPDAASSVVTPTPAWTVREAAKTFLANPAEVETSLSPIEKTLLHQITKLSEELEVSKQKNEILEQTILREDVTSLLQDDENEGGMYLRLGLKTLGLFVLLSVVQRKFFVSGFVSIFGAALVGGLLTYEQEAAKRRRSDE